MTRGVRASYTFFIVFGGTVWFNRPYMCAENYS